MAHIDVTVAGGDEVQVTVREGGSETRHVVIVTDEAVDRYGAGSSRDDLVAASFRFLLDREPKESILTRFDLPVIERYFPDFPVRIQDYL